MENIVTTVTNKFISTTKKQGAVKIYSQLLAEEGKKVLLKIE